MNKLDYEFSKLVEEMYQKIENRRLSGELTTKEADSLCNMVSDNVLMPVDEPEEDPWSNSGCSWQTSSC